jgi:hypothetical protein
VLIILDTRTDNMKREQVLRSDVKDRQYNFIKLRTYSSSWVITLTWWGTLYVLITWRAITARVKPPDMITQATQVKG